MRRRGEPTGVRGGLALACGVVSTGGSKSTEAQAQVVVVGGGVAGLNAARLLWRAGVDVQLLEARDRLGGRVLTVDGDGAPSEDGFDLGPSWFWPRMQPVLASLVEELGVAGFGQRSDGDVVFERMSREPAQRYSAGMQQPLSIRVVGGSGALVRALARTVPSDRVLLGTVVTGLALHDDSVRLALGGTGGVQRTMTAEHVVAALPPRLLAATVEFAPDLPSDTMWLWQQTPTWMASHAKFVALYDRPFWYEDGYSGTAQSLVGPLLEIHDATTHSGRAALFGFLGVGPAERARIGQRQLADACLAQLQRIFGEAAHTPTATLYKDWAVDPLTATTGDLTSTGHPPPASWRIAGPWGDRLMLAGSETSPREAGYLAGAVEASARVAGDLLRRLDLRDGRRR